MPQLDFFIVTPRGMAKVSGIIAHRFSLDLRRNTRPTKSSLSLHLSFASPSTLLGKLHPSQNLTLSAVSRRNWFIVGSVSEDRHVVSVENCDSYDPIEREIEEEGRISFDAVEEHAESSPYPSLEGSILAEDDGFDKLKSKAVNASVVLAAGTLAITKLLTIDHDYWHGWTLYEVLRYAPEHNWVAYEDALKKNPVLAKMVISGAVYTLGDWIAQCYEGKPLFEFGRTRMFRSGLVGFALHGSLSHYYYQFCEALFPLQDWWVVPAKVAFDQTVWAAVWNSIYYMALGFLRLEPQADIFCELKATFWPMLTVGWKLWPFAHLITYSVIPVEQRLLWVDCVELIWVTILSTYSNEKSEARISEASMENACDSSSNNSPEE